MNPHAAPTTIEYKIKDNGEVLVFFGYNEYINNVVKTCGGIWTKFATRNGWKLPSEAAFETMKNRIQISAWIGQCNYVDGYAPKPEAEELPTISIYSLESLDGEHRAAFVADALGY